MLVIVSETFKVSKGIFLCLLALMITSPNYGQVPDQEGSIVVDHSEFSKVALDSLSILKKEISYPLDSIEDQFRKLEEIREGALHSTPEKMIIDSLKSIYMEKSSPLLDSVERIAGKIRKIYSEETLRRFYDSLLESKLVDPPIIPDKQEVTEEELIEEINNRVMEQDVYQRGQTKVDSVRSKIPNDRYLQPDLPQQFEGITDLSEVRLSEEELSKLMPLAGQQIDTKYLPLVDSIRRVNLKEKALILKEERLSKYRKVTRLTERPDFWQRSYFEGIVGFFYEEGRVALSQASPALGFHFLRDVSLGVGPNFQFNRPSDSDGLSALGLRSFVKAEIFKQKGYLQIESIVHGGSHPTENGGNGRYDLLLGGGYLLGLSRSWALNLAVFYRATDSGLNTSTVSPFSLRLGISPIKNIKPAAQ